MLIIVPWPLLPSIISWLSHGGSIRTRQLLRARAVALAAMFLCSASWAAAPQTLDLTQYRGRVVIVDFWASWCKPCRQSMPWLNEMHSRFGSQGLVVIGVNVDAQRADAERFLRDVPVKFELVYDPEGALAGQYKLQGMPMSFVFDRNGKLSETFLGFRAAHKPAHEDSLRKLLAKPVN